MGRNSEKNSTGSGLELDKIDLSALLSSGSRTPAPDAQAPPPPPPETTRQNKKQFYLTLAAAIMVLALLFAITIFLKKQDLSLSFLSVNPGNTPGSYLRVGPISATLANNDIIKFSVDIDCTNESLKQQLAGKDSLIRDRILAVLTAPGTDELLRKRQYEAIKAQLRESLGRISREPLGDIYFADLITY